MKKVLFYDFKSETFGFKLPETLAQGKKPTKPFNMFIKPGKVFCLCVNVITHLSPNVFRNL